ncbi:hypothetical protein Ddc_03623 [Ditylenchus destructor]|nr:hypothetical protein Ddc_03623 [Ditylenchus destructor]
MFKHKSLTNISGDDSSQDRTSRVFDQNDVSYMCCCSSIHVKQGVLLIGIVSAVIFIFSLCTLPFSTPDRSYVFFLELFFLFVDLIAITFLFRAHHTEKPYQLLPFIVIEVFYLVCFTSGAFLSIYGYFNPRSEGSKILVEYFIDSAMIDDVATKSINIEPMDAEVAKIITAFSAVMLSLVSLITLWWTKVTVGCFLYFRHLREQLEMNGGKKTNRYVASPYHIDNIA